MDENVTTTMAEETTQTADAGSQGQQTAEASQENANAFQKFLSGLFGGKKDAGTGEQEQQGKESTPEASDSGKTFTQEELDAAISEAQKKWAAEAAEAERVKNLTPEEKASEEQRKRDEEIADLRSQILKKELKESAVKALEKEGFPVGLAEVLDYSSKERMEQTLESTTKNFKDSLAAAIQNRLKGRTPEGLGGAAATENLLRDQIAKNIRGL